jgi:hypothetical protein
VPWGGGGGLESPEEEEHLPLAASARETKYVPYGQ